MMPDNDLPIFAPDLPVMTSFAQNREDVLLRRVLAEVERGFYVDVGAQSPDEDSVTRHFYDRGWRGINVEPHPHYFAQLAAARPRDINISRAASNRGGRATFRFIDGSGLSSLHAEASAIAARHGFATREDEVELFRLEDVLRTEAPADIHFLKVDVEGEERAVLEGANLRLYRPWIVLVEATLPTVPTPCWDRFEDVLLAARYEPVYFDGLNRWYLRQESLHLKSRFSVPVCVFDHFLTWREVASAPPRPMAAPTRQPVQAASFSAAFGRR